jgi:3-methyladenine DNA glycosylase AlkD
MTYSEFLGILYAYKEEDFAQFQRRLIFTKQEILGVRTPVLRKIAKQYKEKLENIFSFPDVYYETTFIKLATLSLLPYEEFVEKLEKAVSLIDNWATCDSFKGKCIETHKDDFLPHLDRIFLNGGEFEQRYVLVCLLNYYMDKKYFPLIEKYLQTANKTLYYIHMAAAWLVAELLVKFYEYGITILEKGFLDKKTHNKAIQKAIESYRLTNEQKGFLRSLKIRK